MIFPSPTGTSLTKLSLAGNNLIIPGQSDFPARDGKIKVCKKGRGVRFRAFQNTAETRLVNRTGVCQLARLYTVKKAFR
jgi:hypothetical protein